VRVSCGTPKNLDAIQKPMGCLRKLTLQEIIGCVNVDGNGLLGKDSKTIICL
jgi:hypothetical protein